MPLTRLTLDTLRDLDDGRPALAYGAAVAQAVTDCMDRPGNRKARTVTLELQITPEANEEGQCDAVTAAMAIKCRIPNRTTKDYSLAVNRKGHLIFSSTNPENVDQLTIDDIADPATGRVDRGDGEEL